MYRPVERYVRAFGVATLLFATCLPPLLLISSVTPAFADGGAGGSALNGSVAGGTGATGFDGQTGGAGVTRNPAGSGGGGGGGAGGGTGGDGGHGGGTGGPGGTALLPNGQTGTAATPGNGAGGGGGGYNGNGAGTATIDGTSLTGGNGGAGGAAGPSFSAGGGGGAGGYGAIVTGAGTSTVNTGAIVGGTGGVGGNTTNSTSQGGGGGDGGVGVQFTASGATISIGSGTVISGGAGGAGGTGPAGNGANGAGGVGIVGSGLTIIDSGTVRGGLGGDGTTRANAITFTGGTNLLELQRGVGFTGNIVVSGGTGTLQLGGGIDNSLDVSTIGSLGSGAQYQGFSSFTKTGGSTWTLSNTTATTTSWAINQGALSISADNNLGAAAGGLSFDGGKLETTATLSTARAITLNGGGGTFQVDTGTTTTLTGAIGGPGGLSKLGTGTLTLTNSGNNYSGLTQINAGTLALTGGGMLAQSSGVFVGAGATFDISGVTSGVTIQDLTGSVGSAVALGAKTLTVGTSNSTTYSGDIGGVGGSLVKQGPGTLTLSGRNTYSGDTTVSAGTLEGTTTSLQGNITNNATVSFNQATSGAYGGVISGGGAVNVSGGRTVTFSAVNTYSGATTVGANTTLALTSGTFNSSSGLNLAGVGATFDISAATGTLVIKDLSGVAGTVINLAGHGLAAGGTTDTSFGGVIQGAGGVFVKNGSGTLTLSGANTYSGQQAYREASCRRVPRIPSLRRAR